MSVPTNPETHITHLVDAARLQDGVWCQRREKTIGEGDIVASYSADRIGTDQPIRKPFTFQGSPWVCVSLRSRNGATVAEAFRLTKAEVFDRQPVSYSEKTADSEAARNDPNGFYDRMKVQYAGKAHVLRGPPALFAAGPSRAEQPEQMSLFGPTTDGYSPG
jgi:hypothetical protein